MAEYGTFLSTFIYNGQQGIQNLTSNLLYGNADPGGHHIWDYIENANYASLASEPGNGPNTTFTEDFAYDYMGTILTASGINNLWKYSYVYIVAAEAKNGDCKNDNRIESDIKYCRTDTEDGNVYGIYTYESLIPR
jgi:hypothetical protein